MVDKHAEVGIGVLVNGSQMLEAVAGTLVVEGSQLEAAVGDNLGRGRGGGGERGRGRGGGGRERGEEGEGGKRGRGRWGERKACNYTCIPASLPGPAHLFLTCSIYRKRRKAEEEGYVTNLSRCFNWSIRSKCWQVIFQAQVGNRSPSSSFTQEPTEKPLNEKPEHEENMDLGIRE